QVLSLPLGLFKVKFQPEENNLSQQEVKTLEELQTDNSIIIKPADKGSVTVIMDKSDYQWEVNRQLADGEYYQPLSKPIYPETKIIIQHLLKKLKEQKVLNRKQILSLTGTDPPRPRYFYLLPKIHKDPSDWAKPFLIPKGRPIVSDCSSESYGSAKLLDFYLNPISQKHPNILCKQSRKWIK
uniref:Uncharacterized protein n=1 Tax=Poecilia mexicana TaxID=48701 RepID=A0A3B3WF36_9TELE